MSLDDGATEYNLSSLSYTEAEVVLILIGLPFLLMGLCCSAYCLYPYRYRCMELICPSPSVETVRRIEGFGLIISTLGVLLLLISTFLLQNYFVIFVGFMLSCCWCFGLYVFSKEGEHYGRMHPESKVIANLGYQVVFQYPKGSPSAVEFGAMIPGVTPPRKEEGTFNSYV